MKKYAVTIFGIIAWLGFLNITVEARPEKRLDPVTQTCRVFTFEGNWSGYKTFQNSCKSCHSRGNDKGAPFLFTESKTSEGWNRVFAKRYPVCARNGSWQGLEKSDILFLNDYLYANGLGSYDANTDCG